MPEQDASISQLGYALLGLIAMNPSTGYELRKLFESTPMKGYSNSPGAIYPAIKRLQAVGAVRTREVLGKTSRTAQLLTISPKGTKALQAWLRVLPSVEEIGKDLDGALLRFSYLDLLQDLDFSLRFLEALEAALRHQLREVTRFSEQAAPHMPLHGSLALDFGVATLKSKIAWARKAKKQISHAGRSSGDR